MWIYKISLQWSILGGIWMMLKDEKSPHMFPLLSVFILKGEEKAALWKATY